jgi:hypothetical protein
MILFDDMTSDDFALNEKRPDVTSEVGVEVTFFVAAIDKVPSPLFGLPMDGEESLALLFVLISLLVTCGCCRLVINRRHFEQYHRQRGSLISVVLTVGL